MGRIAEQTSGIADINSGWIIIGTAGAKIPVVGRSAGRSINDVDWMIDAGCIRGNKSDGKEFRQQADI